MRANLVNVVFTITVNLVRKNPNFLAAFYREWRELKFALCNLAVAQQLRLLVIVGMCSAEECATRMKLNSCCAAARAKSV
jgi:hypothetical protein